MKPKFAAILLLAALAPPVRADDDIVYLRQKIDAAYSTPAAANALNRNDFAFLRTTRVKKGDTLSGIISREYKVGLSNAPAAARIIQEFVNKKNGLTTDTTLQPDQILQLPDLPPIARSHPNPANPANAIPKLDIKCRQPMDAGEAVANPLCDKLMAANAQPGAAPPAPPQELVFDDLRKGAQDVIQIRALPRAQALALTMANPDLFLVDSAGLTLKLAVPAIPDPTTQQSPVSVAALAPVLSAPAKRHPVLIIIDDSWPDDAAFRDAKEFFVNAISSIRNAKKLGPATFSVDFLAANTTSYSAPLPAGYTPHASIIKQAIAPYQAAEPADKRVKVIYLPIIRSQRFADEILANLVALNLSARTLGANFNNNLDQIPASASDLSWAQGQTAVNNTATALDPNGNLNTDQSIIEAIMQFSDMAAVFPDTPIFINMSWTVPDHKFNIVFPDNPYGYFVAAAGNDCPDGQCGNSVYDLKRQFAFRSATPGDVIAVMNIGADGNPVCDSSLLDTSIDVPAVAFDGSLSASDCGGTSFAAPRVGWLLAAREAQTAAPDSIVHWRVNIRDEFSKKSNDTGVNFNKIRLNIDQLFSIN